MKELTRDSTPIMCFGVARHVWHGEQLNARILPNANADQRGMVPCRLAGLTITQPPLMQSSSSPFFWKYTQGCRYAMYLPMRSVPLSWHHNVLFFLKIQSSRMRTTATMKRARLCWDRWQQWGYIKLRKVLFVLWNQKKYTSLQRFQSRCFTLNI